MEQAETKWAAQIVCAPKNDGSLRFCVGYQKINARIKRHSYLSPRMDECIDSPRETVVISTLDANNGSWQVEVDKVDRDKTSFTFHRGVYKFVRMRFESKNAPGAFERAIDFITSPVNLQPAQT